MRIFWAGLLCIFGIAHAAAQQTNNDLKLPEIGVVASDAISIDKEKLVGDYLMRQLRGQAPIISDPLLEEYIQDLGNRMVINAQNAKFPFHFFLVNNNQINAFAFFGGNIGIHTGLILNAENESELASVVAHEIAHVTQRHIARGIQARNRSSALQIASLFGGLLLAMVDPEAGMAAVSASTAAGQQMAVNYTRSNEKEADRIGLQILTESGYNPEGAVSFFQTLSEKYRSRSRPPAFLLTHPLPESRVADIRSRVLSIGARPVPPKLEFHLAKARIIARYTRSATENLPFFERQVSVTRGVPNIAARYGLALTYYALERYDEAQAIVNRLRTIAPENLFFIDTMTDILIARDRHQDAITMLSDKLKVMPRNRVLVLNLANANLQHEKTEEAEELLKDYLLVNENHYLSHQLLADVYVQQREWLSLHQTRAEIYAMSGGYRRAIDELQTAYTYANERPLEKQRIRARMDQFREAESRLKRL